MNNNFNHKLLISDFFYSTPLILIDSILEVKIKREFKQKLVKDLKEPLKIYCKELIHNELGIKIDKKDIDHRTVIKFIDDFFGFLTKEDVSNPECYSSLLKDITKYKKNILYNNLLFMRRKGDLFYIQNQTPEICLYYLKYSEDNYHHVKIIQSDNIEDCIQKLNNKIKLEALIK